MYKKYKKKHTIIIRLIIVERRILIDNILFINIRAKIYNYVFYILL